MFRRENLVMMAGNFACTIWHYVTTENTGWDLRYTSYFHPAADMLRPGDRIVYNATDEYGELVVLDARDIREASYVELATAYKVKR